MLNYHILSTYTVTVLIFITSSSYFLKKSVFLVPNQSYNIGIPACITETPNKEIPGKGKEATENLAFNCLLRYMAKLSLQIFQCLWIKFRGSVCINCCLNFPLACLLYKIICTTATMRITHFFYAIGERRDYYSRNYIQENLELTQMSFNKGREK